MQVHVPAPVQLLEPLPGAGLPGTSARRCRSSAAGGSIDAGGRPSLPPLLQPPQSAADGAEHMSAGASRASRSPFLRAGSEAAAVRGRRPATLQPLPPGSTSGLSASPSCSSGRYSPAAMSPSHLISPPRAGRRRGDRLAPLPVRHGGLLPQEASSPASPQLAPAPSAVQLPPMETPIDDPHAPLHPDTHQAAETAPPLAWALAATRSRSPVEPTCGTQAGGAATPPREAALRPGQCRTPLRGVGQSGTPPSMPHRAHRGGSGSHCAASSPRFAHVRNMPSLSDDPC